ncbi:uncharacterized protein [Diadema setosum]|uniref:uncharacterized protein n=1 Tax=Diadema setosum TaxID=31175 RepID=UPI003B3A82B4
MNKDASRIGTAPNVRGWKGEDIRLQCDIQEEPLAVLWVKGSILRPELKVSKAEFFDGSFRGREERFDIDKNFSLVITDLEVADEGRYDCQVLLKNFQSLENSTIITIRSMASRHVIEECVDKSQSRQSRCTYQSPSNTPSFTLTCVVSGFKPNVSMLWTEESGKRLDSVISQQNTLSDDTYERFATITVSAKHGTEQTFMCVATGDSLNGTSTVEITVLPVSGLVKWKRDHSGLIIGLAIGVPVALATLFLLVGKYLQNKHPDYLPQKGCGWNPCWRRPNITEHFYEEAELMLRQASLTKEQVQQCKEELKAYYRVSRRRVRVDPLNFMELVELDDIYTNLSIIDRSSMRKTPIAYGDLFHSDGNLLQRLLIQGEGGVGKTTLCAKIAWDWCQGRILQDLDMVLLIPLRDVKNATSIGAIVKTYLSHSNIATNKKIDDYISANLSRVLFIFDGFDEFDEQLSEQNSSAVIRILGVEQYKSCKVIVTTRPWRTDEFMMDKSLAEAYTLLSVEGFNTENLTTYIRRYFRIRERDNLAESLISFMQENDVIRWKMAPFPIYCAMLCLIWNDCREEKRKEMQTLQTFSKVFGEMISFLKEHYASKLCKNLKNQCAITCVKKAGRAIEDIGEIALNGLLNKKLSFPEEQFREYHDAMETCCRVGVLTIERAVMTRERRRDVNIQSFVVSTVSFPHKLFQEYIAGVYIENLFANDRDKYDNVKNELHSRPREFRYLLYFTSALRSELGLDIIHGLINCDNYSFVLSNSPGSADDNQRNFCVDVAFECHTEEATRAVGERWKEHKVASYYSEHTNSGVVFMVRFNQVETLLVSGVRYGRSVSRDLAEGMCSSYVLRKVEIFDSQFHTDFYKILSAEALNCQIEDLSLYFDDDYLNQSSVGGDFVRWVFTMPRLSNFRLKCSYLPENVPSTAAASASSCQIQDLDLHLDIPPDHSRYQSSMGGDFVRWIFTMPCLSKFSLRCPYLPGSFFSAAAAASASTCQIQDVDLHFHSPPDDSRYQSSMNKEFVQWVFTMPCLSKFSLRCPYLPDSFLSTAAASASSCQFEDLDLHFDNPPDDSRYQSSMGGDFVRWVFTTPCLSKFSLRCPYLPDSFLSIAAISASSCQIQDLELCFDNDPEDPKYQSSMGQDLIRWVFTMPRLSSFTLQCPYLPDSFLSKAAASAPSCQIRKLFLYSTSLYFFERRSRFVSESAAATFAEFLCRMPHLTIADLICDNLPKTFFTSIASQASRSKVDCITVNQKPLSKLLHDYLRGTETPSNQSDLEGKRRHETDQGSGQEHVQAPDKTESSRCGDYVRGVDFSRGTGN